LGLVALSLLGACVSLLSACGNVGYVRQAARASEQLAQATRAGGAEWAPYEVTLARAYLQKAAEEAAEAEYEHAFELARDAETLADEALRKTARRRP
ncbi:MAG TPA: hypothetical protein VFS00_02860, partial [Polyangiaceae bacterium]|nr:hypothetical protein [Polyangiaceae bacterium]